MRRWVFAAAPPAEERRSAVIVFAAALPGVVLAAVVLGDWLMPANQFRFLVPLLVAVPALAAATWGIQGTITFILFSFAAHFVLAFLSGRNFSDSFYGGIVGLVVISAVSLLPGHLRGREKKTVQRLRSVAETVQHAVLAPLPKRVEGLRTSAGYRAAHEEARLGGDLYDVMDTPYGVRMIVGDAKGKGMSAVEAAANLLGAFRAWAPYASDLPTLAERLEHIVRRHNLRHHGDVYEEFITATIASVPPAEPVAEIVCCGHPGPLLLQDSEITDVKASLPALPLGLGGLGRIGYRVDKLSFDVGDRLLFYTDGVTEARDATGSFYPLAQRAAAWNGSEPERLIKDLARDLISYTGGRLSDDVALLACERLAGSFDPADHSQATDTRQRSAAYTATRENARAARLMTTHALTSWGKHASIDTVCLIIDELVSNAIRHGQEPIRVTLRLHDSDMLFGEISDTSDDPPTMRTPDPNGEGGYGLQLVDSLAHRWGYRQHSRGKTVWFVAC